MASKISATLQQLHVQLRAIEEMLLQRPVGPREYRRLFHQLEKASDSLQGLALQSAKTQNLFARTMMSGLNSKIVDLAGRVVNKKVDTEVAKIQKEASHLAETLTAGTSTDLSKETKILQRHIQALLHDHRPSKENLAIIAEAKETLRRAEQKLEGGDVDKASPTKHFDWLARQPSPIHFVQGVAEDLIPGDMEELFDIAAWVHNKDGKMALSRYNQLSSDMQSRIARHLEHLQAEMFEDVFETIQALITTAHDLVGTGVSYPTEQEVEEFFQERKKVLREESAGDDMLSM